MYRISDTFIHGNKYIERNPNVQGEKYPFNFLRGNNRIGYG